MYGRIDGRLGVLRRRRGECGVMGRFRVLHDRCDHCSEPAEHEGDTGGERELRVRPFRSPRT
jgi:hypothetical protein